MFLEGVARQEDVRPSSTGSSLLAHHLLVLGCFNSKQVANEHISREMSLVLEQEFPTWVKVSEGIYPAWGGFEHSSFLVLQTSSLVSKKKRKKGKKTANKQTNKKPQQNLQLCHYYLYLQEIQLVTDFPKNNILYFIYQK